MDDEFLKYSVVPKDFEKNDPRALLYHYPSFPVVKFAKLMQTFSFYKTLNAVQDVANRQGYVLVPARCMHWGRIQKFGPERLAKVGKHNFYFMRMKEMTDLEISKLNKYIEERITNDRYDN